MLKTIKTERIIFHLSNQQFLVFVIKTVPEITVIVDIIIIDLNTLIVYIWQILKYKRPLIKLEFDLKHLI